jgi:integrase
MPLTLYRRGKIWHYRGTVAGRRLRGSTKTASKETAQRIAANEEQRAWKGHFDPQSVLTFAQAAMLYRQAEKSDRFLRKIEDYWRDTPVKVITPGAIRAAAIALYPNAGPATRNRQAIVPTQAIINHAAESELCPHIKVARFEAKQRRVKEPVTWDWICAFMAYAKKPNLAALACFMFLTGSRISQALAVDWAHVDFKSAKVLIRATRKGDDDRLAHMPSELIVALANIPGERTGKVFGFKSRGNCRTQWAGAIRRAGIKPLSYHSCRHGFATGLLDQGVNPITVANRGGWKSARHVFETYGHDVAADDVTQLLTGTKSTREERKRNVAN